jgi:hypothetical protein
MSRLIFFAPLVCLLALAAPAAPLFAQEILLEVPAAESPNLTTMRVLRSRSDFHVEVMPLSDFVKFLTKRYKIAVRLDLAGLERAGVDPSAPVSADIKHVPLSAALRQTLRRLNLTYRVINGVVRITDRPREPAPAPLPRQRAIARNRPMMMLNMGAPVLAANPAQQVLAQLRPRIQVELIFVKRVCAPNSDQLRQLKEGLEKYVRDSTDDFEELRQGRGGRQESASVPAARRLQEKLAVLIQSDLSREKADRYRDELRKRDADEHAMCACALVAFLDRELLLSAKQRESLNAALAAKWDDSWCQTIEMGIMQGQQYVPSVPDELIEPHLNAAQTDLWESMQKVGLINWGFQPIQMNLLGLAVPDLEQD